MNVMKRARSFIQRFWHNTARPLAEPDMIASGWDKYAQEWKPEAFQVLAGSPVQHLGDEWTAEDVEDGGTSYGLTPDVVTKFDHYINQNLLDPFLPSHASEGLEIGPGGGRVTALLIPRTDVLHVADPSAMMLRHLRHRFATESNLRYYHTDGMTLPALQPGSLNYVVAFDVFVHFEPRLAYWYLRQIPPLLKPGGTAIIHYANILTPIGWRQFEFDLQPNLEKRTVFATFGVMCPQLMTRFLEALELEVISADVGLIPRDSIAVFRRRIDDTSTGS